jgi:hypothetical protein
MIGLDPETTASRGFKARLAGLMVWLIPVVAIVLAVLEGIREWVRPEAVTWVRHLIVVCAGAVAAAFWALALWRGAIREIGSRVREGAANLEAVNEALRRQIE